MPDRFKVIICQSFWLRQAPNSSLRLGQGKREFAGAPHVVDSQDVHLGAMKVSVCLLVWKVTLFGISGSTWYAARQLSRRPLVGKHMQLEAENARH